MRKSRVISGVIAVSLILSSTSVAALADGKNDGGEDLGPSIAVEQEEEDKYTAENGYVFINTNDTKSSEKEPTIIEDSIEEDATVTDASSSDALEIATVTDPLYNVGHEEPCVNGLISDSIYMENIYKSDSQNAIYFVKRVNDETYSYYYRYRVYKYDMDNNTITMMDESDRVSSSMDYYYINDKLYYTPSKYSMNSSGDQCKVYEINLLTGEKSLVFDQFLTEDAARCVAVDDFGRIYIGTTFKNQLMVFSPEGELITSENVELSDIYDIDSENGNIYYHGECNWVYWGYNHYMSAFSVARLKSDNTIELAPNDNVITILYQNGFFTHYGCVERISDRYIADLSTFSGDHLFILDSSKINPSEVTETSTSISLIDSSVNVSDVNLSNPDAVVLGVQTMRSNYVNDCDISSVGTRCAYYQKDGKEYLFVYTASKEIVKYDMKNKTRAGVMPLDAEPYKIMMVGNKLVTLSSDDDGYHIHSYSIDDPTEIHISGPNNLQVGDLADYQVSFNTNMALDYTFTTSNPSVLAIDSEGHASAWKAGKATLTVKTADGKMKDSMVVNVSDKAITPTREIYTSIRGKVSNNKNKNNYTTWSKPVTSYLTEVDANTLMRTEFIDGKLHIEYIDQEGNITDSKDVSIELGTFGGFFAGKKAYYVVSGNPNKNQSDDKEVIRVRKYTKDWKLSKVCKIKGANTYYPFDAGSLRMDEVNGHLYIATCHTMYASGDGYHHQANMIFKIKESDMTLEDSYSDVMNLSYGYVSHSFNQFIKIQDGIIYRSEHGEGYPTGITITGFKDGNKVTDMNLYGTMAGYDGYSGGNYTGASLGGFEISNTHTISIMNQDINYGNNMRNIRVVTCNLSTLKNEAHYITDYTEADKKTCYTPQLVELNDGQYLAMWMEHDADKNTDKCAFAHLNNEGQLVGKIVRNNMALSDCQPIVQSDGTVSWYVTDGSSIRIYNINPYALEKNVIPVVSLSKKTFTYDGKAKKPTVTVKVGSKTLVSGTDYTLKCSDNVNAGLAKVVVTFKGNYAGKKTVYYEIQPKGTSVSSLVKASKAITVKWKAQEELMAKTKVTGYQIQLARDKEFTLEKKSVTVKGPNITAKKITGLKGARTYYVRIRTYKTVNGVNVYSAWSTAKGIKTLE